MPSTRGAGPSRAWCQRLMKGWPECRLRGQEVRCGCVVQDGDGAPTSFRSKGRVLPDRAGWFPKARHLDI